MTVTQAYLSDVTPPEHRTKIYGYNSAVFGAGLIFGPVIGGLYVNFILTKLRKERDIAIAENLISLRESGKFKGQQVVRRHRLAERLFHDVVDLSPEKINSDQIISILFPSGSCNSAYFPHLTAIGSNKTL